MVHAITARLMSLRMQVGLCGELVMVGLSMSLP